MNIPTPSPSKSISTWLFTCAGLVLAMVVIGGITRLTDSGLSIVQWQPFKGTLPPLNEAAWQDMFDLYKTSPEFQKKHFWMDLSDFKAIFFWEWVHRFLGRLIGLVYALPLVYFWARRMIPPGRGWALLGLLALGAAQGLMGWLMVKSGLIDRPDVSHFRLAAHFMLALLICAALLWQALSFRSTSKQPQASLFRHGLFTLTCIIFTLTWGAFTAGLDAGLIYNDSFPKMGSRWIPDEITNAPALLYALIEDPAAVQFTHRWLAIITVIVTLSFCAHALRKNHAFPAIKLLAFMILLQAALGIATLLSGIALPLAILHQAGAVITLTLLTVSLYKLKS